MNSKALYGAVLLGTAASLFVACGDGDSTKILVCNAKQVTCLNSQGGEVCSADGTLKLPFSCGAGETCCDPRQSDCDDVGGGAGQTSSPGGGVCVGSCVPGTHECSSNEVSRVCSEDGRSWVVIACAPGTGCDPATGTCERTDEPDDTVTVCEQGQTTCVDSGSVKECEEDGSGWVYKPCPTGTACVDGACDINDDVECVPNSGVCADRQIARICNAQGTGYEEVDCADLDMECLDGNCRGPVCSLGEVRCDDVRDGNVFTALVEGNYNPLLVYTCNADGTAWTISECAPTEICAYDNIAATTVNAFIEDLKSAYANSEAPPVFDVPETSRAACIQPECAAPFALREYFGYDSFSNRTGGSFICGDPAQDDPLGSFSLCEGLPPYNNLHWANYACPDGTECTYDGLPNESEGSIGAYITGPVCDRTCVPGTTACFQPLNGTTGAISTVGEATITCNDDGEWDYGSVTTCAEILDSDLAREQWCGPNLQGTADSYNIGICMEPACVYWFGAFETYILPEGVGACGTNGQFYQCLPDGTFDDPRDCAACQVATGAPGSGFPDTYAGYDPGTCSDCIAGSQACVIASSANGGTPYYRQCESNGSITINNCSGGAICHDFLDLDTGSDTYGLSRIVCGGECAPNDTECGINFDDLKKIRTCGSNGQWGDFEDCAEGACHEDNTTSGNGRASCEAECIPGTFTCPVYLGADAVECMANGRFDDLNPVACDTNAAEYCRDDIGCSVCDDGRTGSRPETRCNPDDATQIQICKDGGWDDPVTCPGAPGACLNYGTASYCAPDNSGNNGGAAGTAGTAGTAGDPGTGGVGGTGGTGGTGGVGGTAGSSGAGAGAGGAAGDAGFGGIGGQAAFGGLALG